MPEDIQPTRPLVSIVITSFNEERYLHEAIDSALAQTYPNVEVVVVDDGSTDRSCDIAAGFGDGVVLLRKANGGISSARNAGIDLARGEYVTFLDGDDILLPDFVSRTVQVLDGDPAVSWAYTQLLHFGRESEPSDFPEFRSRSAGGGQLPAGHVTPAC